MGNSFARESFFARNEELHRLPYLGKKFVIATVIQKGISKGEEIEKLESFEEFAELIKNLGGVISGRIIQKRERFDPTFFLGPGKLKEMIQEYEFDILAVDSILKPVQIVNLEKELKKEVLDREYVIIKIFEERATSREGKLQVKLAELKYKLSKLSGIGKEMSQLGGMLGTRGPGETKTEELRRHIVNQIRSIEAELESIKHTRFLHRERRKKMGFVTFSLVGYTNVGKSTLLRALTGEDVLVKDQLFTTLETRVGLLKDSKFSDSNKILISDTVGFISNLPHSLVSAFKSTLEEVIFSDALIVVLDASRDCDKQFLTIKSVLDDIKVPQVKPRIVVFNKIDKAQQRIYQLRRDYQDAVFVSALKGVGISELVEKIIDLAQKICTDGK